MSLTERIAALTPEQRALFEKLRETKRHAARAHQPPPVRRVSGSDGAGDWPLSLDQERYWFMEQLRPSGAGLNIGTATRMRGPLSVPAFAAALGQILRRHAAWRTTFPMLDGGPVQRVAVSRRQLLAIVDVSDLPEERREAEALRLVGEDAAAPFDLERGPLVRTSLIRVSQRDHVCLLTAHHLIVDFLSFQIVWAELAALYAAFSAGGPPLLPEPPVNYSDFAVWQREWLQGEVLADLVSWWRERLEGFPLVLDLPTDRPRPAVMRMRGGRRLLSFSRELSEALRTFSRQEGATLFMTVLAALAALLHRDSGQEKLILGANNANRNRPEIQPVVGTFLTQVAFPLDLEGDPTCRELLARVRQSALGVYAHQDLSFGKLVEAIQPQRDTSRQPIIQTLVQVLEGQASGTDLAGVNFEAVDAYDGNARYDLLLTLFDHPTGLSGSFEYDADLFDPATAERLCELLLLQAAAATADPDLRLSALPVLTPAARHQVLAEWSDTACPLPGWTVPERFAGWAERAPDALAVAAAGEELTFGELGRRADALAARLRAAGVGAESRVALLLDRTVDMPVALLGVWKAGGACVLLDASSPPERLAALLKDAEPAAEIHPGLRLEVSSPRQGRVREGASPRPEHLAYMIYTSGTTGLPKAVMVEHGGLAAVLDAVVGRFGFTPGDRMPHLARFSFDISLFELFAPLLGGGACEILQQEEVLEPAALLATLERATRFHAVPSLMRQVAASARAAGAERFAGLRTLFTGGDLVPPDLLVELGEVFPSAAVVVLYGPTEGTIVCTAHPVPPDARPERALIGRPFANAEMRVIDRWGDAPLGVPGELWIGGPGVARGYFRRDELTAERFVERDGRRYYRTGDLVRHLADGALEFLGRTDLQVKVRGFRIEPGEVEGALLAHPAVREAVVVARAGRGGDSRGGNQLVAYVVAATGAAPPIEEIRAFLRTRLPEYMVPGILVPLAALPLSPNGKVDRKALPAPEPAGEALAGSTPPRDAREERLAAIWREVLGLERVGVHDNFFQLGGDSILSIQVVARARREGLLISPQQLFENQTIAGLAAVAGSVEEAGAAIEGPIEGEAPLTPIQRRFFAEERREPWRFNQAVVLTPRERLAAGPLAAALARLAAHHDSLRLRFTREDAEWRQFHAAPVPVPLLEVDLTALPLAERKGALDTAMEQLQTGLDLAQGPLFTAALFRLAEENRLLLTAHHLVVDGVSWRVLLEDLAAAYRGLELPAKTTSWQRWAELLAAHGRSVELEEEIPYWLAQRPGPPLPVDLDGDSSAALATVSVELGPEETRALLQEVPQVYRTQANDLLLAALVRAFAAWTGEGTLGIDLEGHGREEIFPGVDLSRTAGWFTTLFPVALTLSPGAGPREAIREVKESLRAVPRRGLGYGLLRYLAAAGTGERLAALPAPEVSFNYLGRFDPAMGEGGLFAFAPEAPRGAGGEATTGRHLFAIDALVLGDRLRINWTYDPGRHLPATTERLARGFLAEIVVLVSHCLSPEAGGFTPSDFPLAGLDQAALDRVVGNDSGVEDLYPLAPMQQGMLFHSLYTAGADLYVEQLTAELAGRFDQAAFIAAWRRVVERHGALRTGFLWQEVGFPLQLVRRQAELPWTAEDWRGLPPAALETLWRSLLAADRARGFDLDRPPLLRLTLVRVGEEEHRLIWSSHHLLFDGWCFPLLLSEVFALYEAAVAGREALLPPPPRPYRDYIAWLAERDQAAAERYWRRTLAGFTAPTPAPFDHPAALGGADGNHAGDYYERTVMLPAPRAAGLESLAQRLQVTLNTLVQGAWALLLSRYTQVSEVVFGAVVSGRPAELAGVESMVGLFINSLPVRVEIPEDEAASSWLARLQAGQFEQSQYAWTPLARIQALSEVPAGEPLFTSLLAFQNYPLDPAVSERLSELRIGDVALSERTNYPLTLAAVARGDLALRLTADRRFEPATTRRMLAHLENLLGALAADPERPPRFLPLLGAAERHQLTVEWSDTARPLPEWTVPGRFAERTAATPEALALVAGGEALTFAALDGRAEELARRLRAAGVATGSRVALLLDRTADMPAALLAVWKAGGVCVPLDPASPAERLASLLADAEPAVVIHRGLRLEAFLPVTQGGPEGTLPRPEHLAYMIYTSGTTGLPKAVMVEHGGLAAVLAAVVDRFGFGPGDRMPHLARFSFDISFLELFAPLLGGGACEILDQEEILDPAALMAALARATRFHAVPSLMRQVAAAARESGPERFAGLRTLFTGGDRVPPDLLAELRQAFPTAEIVVLYGPTEATIVCTYYPVPYHPVPPEAPLEKALIGRPFDNVEVRVVAGWGDVPPGAPGELWIGGPGVARGYFHREELTADRFVEREGRRYYRTGDLVRRLADGTLEFLGRTDLQVKIRGFRVEPGEIEIQLAIHPGVKEAVVVARAGTGADARLVAYVVAEGAAVPAEELQTFLRNRLPEYMVPAAFVVLPALPLTPNGKVDLKALPAPEPAREAAGGSTPPRDAREELLAAIWRGVLGLERVGVHDNFFQLGGDSILSIQVVARARREGLLISPQQLFENQTIAGLAAVAGSAEDAGAAAEGPVEGEAPLTPIQRRFFAEERRQPWRFNQAVVLIPRERLAAAPLAAALAHLAGHHDALRLRFAREDGEWRQVHAPVTAAEMPVPLLEVDLTALPLAELKVALDTTMERLQAGLDLARGPLFTATLFRLVEEERLLLTAHHLVVDGVSWRVLLEDLAAAYRGLELPAKTTSWKRWAELLAAHARSGELEEEIPYWLAQRPGPPLPVDLDGDGRGATASVAVELGPEETRALLQEVPQVYRTQVNDLLLAALVRAFAAWTGEGALRVDLEGHGREEIFPGVDLSRTVGWFTTLFPLSLLLPPGGGPREAIQGTKESLRAVPRRGLGYGLLRYLAAAGTGERLAALPAPQVSFNYLGRFDPAMGEGGLFTFAPEAPRGAGGEITPGRHLFAVDALVLGDHLRINWTYDPGRHLPATAERLARGFLAEIAALIAHCRSPEAGGFTPSDFPLAGLDQAALDRVVGNDRGVEDLYPLAPLQQGMLFHSLYTAGSDLYVEQLTAELAGPFDQEAFIAAWRRVVERHPALRTGFLWQKVESPLQLVRRQADLPWTAEDWRGLPPAALESRWRDLLAADRARGFDLDRPPLLRITLVRVGEEEHRLIWSSHHLLFDGWCFPLLLSEVFSLYEAAVAGREAHLPPPPRPYRDYIAWLAERDQAAAERYWRRALAGFTAPTPAPFDHSAALGGAEGSHAADYYERTAVLPASRTAGLESLAQRLQVTLNTLVQGAWALLLSRYAQASDVVFGAVVSGRPAELPGVESMVGLFINSLPVRVEIPEDEAASFWLARLQAGQFEQSQYAWTPLARIQAFSEVPAGEPLFTSLLAFQNYPLDPTVSERLSELRIGDVALSDRTNYPLTLSAVARGDLALRLTADRRFEPATTRRMLAHLENLLNALASNPERPPRSLSLLASAERHQLTVEWNDTATAYPEVSIPTLFAEQAARRPEALALLGPGREDRLSYGELDRRAGALARELVGQGIGRGDLVGLFAERSTELVIAVLAILKTGAAYLPLDPSYPRERLAFMLADGGAPLVLVQPELATLLPAGAARTLPLVPSAFDGAPWSGGDATAADLAYVIYTSGSTGTPKGVAVPHRSVVRLVRDTDYAAFGPDQVFLMVAPVSFDASTFELWGPLLNGGCLAILPPGEVSLDGLERAIHDAGVTTLWLTAGLFHLVVDERLAALAPLRQLLAGGDVLSPPHVARLRHELPGLRLINGYGPTENTTFTTCHRVEQVAGASVPIGRPIANTRALVLDRDLEPAPIGVPGELYAGGAGLAVGYLGRSALTAASFVPALFSERPGERLYRTGDLARRLPDGSLDFLGRADRQVKVRGFRIELGEIEAALADHPAVREAAVVALRDDGRERRLVSWAVPRGTMASAPPPEAVLADLAARLPAYMIPVDLIWLDVLPLSPTGKVDRAALAAMALAVERGEVADLTPPRGAVEETLAAIWSQVLGCERVGVHDSFFRLGGDSILSIQVVARARQAGLVVTPRQIFEEQTIAALAAVATPLAAAEAEQGAVEGDVPLTPVQLYFFAARPAEPHYFNQSLLLLVGEPLAPAPLARAVAALMAHHDALRLRFVETEGGWRAWNAPREESAPLSTLDLVALPPARRAGELEAAATALQAGFDLARGPLFRAARFVLGGGEPERLLLLAHHLVVDGVSWRILLDDLETACSQAAAGSIVSLPAKSTSWKRWAERLAEHARSAEALGELPYWLSASADVADVAAAAAVAPLPRDGEPGEDGIRSVATALGREVTRALLGEATAAYRTQVNDLLLAALAQAFARWTAPATGETRLRFDLEGHGREEVEPGLDLSRTVGWFTTIFPVTLAADPKTGPGEVIREVKETLRAIPRHGLGYGLLRYLGGEETAPLAAAPTPEVAFNYLGQLDGALGSSVRWRPAPESAGPDQSPRARPRHAIEINAWVFDGELRVVWGYRADHHAPATVERLAHGYVDALAALVAHCTALDTGGRTPSDFPLAGLDQRALDTLVGTGASLDLKIEDLYPLAPLQQGMLFEGLFAPDSELYFQQLIAELAGPLDAGAFVRAWQSVVDRHPALRTAFAWEGLEWPLQVVRRGPRLPWTEEDWRQVPGAEVRERLAAWLAADRAHSFDLARPPLMRAALLRTGEDRHRFVWSFHHLLLDGWCLSLIFREVFALYQAAVAGRGRDVLLPAVRPYREFIAWVARQDAAATDDFFRRELAGFTAATRLPLDRPALPAGDDGDPPDQELRLPPSLVAGLTDLAQSRELTLSTLAQGAWALLLARYGDTPDVVFGTVVSGRPAELPGVESMIGLFINTLPVRLAVDPAAPLDLWLAGVQESLLEIRQHETAALAQIQRASEVPPGEPLFQSIVAFENYPVDESLGEGAREIAVTEVTVTGRTDYPLSFAVLPGRRDSDELSLRLAYDRRTDATTARRLLVHLERLLEAFATSPGRALGELPVLSTAERHQLVLEWNDMATETGAKLCLHDLVAAQARLLPAAVALSGEGRGITYAELDRRANQVANHLRGLGVGPDTRVALLAERSLETFVLLLGILKAGGAYVPIDPGTPAERLAFLLADARPALLLAGAGMEDRLRAELERPVPVLELDAALWARIEAASEEPPASGVDPENLAYVIYTSGSTGVPKGVAIPHRSVVSYVRAASRRLGLRAGDRELQFSALSFDASVEEIFAPLAVGAAVVPRRGPAEEPALFLAECAERGITVLSLPTAYWHQVSAAVEAEGLTLPPALRLIVIGGERALPERWAAWGRGSGGQVRLVNAYGPTEGTISATLHEHPGTADPLLGRREVPIGRPLSGMRAHAVDRDLRPVPAGGIGELVLGGTGVARGYLARPGLTAEKFVPDALSGEPGSRLYRTGDLVRLLPGGTFEFAGRLDAQVKVRGFRIEPGEIESVLATHPGLREVAVVAHHGGSSLLAVMVPVDAALPPATVELRAFLAERLPAHMVPTAYALLPALPLTASGKLDRRALERLEVARSEAGGTAPGTSVEKLMADLWREVLGVAEVHLEDDFFALGGHSLLATQLASRVRAAFGVDLPLRRLFEHPVLSALTAIVTAESGAAPEVGKVTRRPPGLDPIPLSSAQERLWFLDRLQPGNPAYTMFNALRARGELSPALLAAVLSEVVRRHEALRTTFQERAGQPAQIIAPPGRWSLPLVDLSGLPDGARRAEARSLAERESVRPFDLARGPLLRSLVVRLGATEHDLLFAMHHVISDGWSMGVLVGEVTALYGATLAGLPSPLPELSVQYADFAVWQRERVSGDELERQLAYWRQQMAGAPASIDLPLDRPRPAVPTYRGGHATASIDAAVTAGLSRLARGQEATLFMVLLAAFQALLLRLTAQDDLPVGSPIANRNREEIEPLIGFFVNMLVLRGDLAGDPPFHEVLTRVRRTTLDAYSHQDLPFDRLVEELHPERQLSLHPLFQVVCVLHNAPMGDMELPGLALSVLGSEVPATRFDLELQATEVPGGPLSIFFVYNADLFDPSTLRRICGYLEVLLQGIVADPGRRLSELPLLRAGELHQLLGEWNDTGGLEPAPDVVTLFADRAAQAPEAPAVTSAAGTLTYGELDRRSTELAHRLRALGVGADVPVGLFAPRSQETVIGALAALKAGGAYLPLDPSHPADRLAFLVRESRIAVVLAAGAEDDGFEWAPEEVRVVWIGAAEAWAGAGDPPAWEPAPALPESLAYVIYTSGSTGLPKGVEISRAGLANLVRWHLRTYGVTSRDRATLIASPAFDAAVWEIWPYLAAGAALHIPDEETRLLPEQLLDSLAADGITLCFLPTPLAEQLLDAAERALPAGLVLRALLTGGDRLVRVPRRPLPFALVNHYGPTESSVVATWETVTVPGDGRPPAIGRPVDGTAVHVVDRALKPVPAGVSGELLIGGAGLARGYLGRPDLTAERFIPDPFGAGRLYRTGDLVRRRPDGALEFLGRIDQQVKIRGYRIELGEIEGALARHPEVGEAAAVLREAAGGGRLVAYVVPKRRAEAPDAGGHIAQWQTLYDETYGRGPSPESRESPTFNIQGWDSSYTGEPIPAAEMREWVDGTVGRLLALEHRRVLEVGCGTGLLLFRVAPHAERYRGTDFSSVALAQVRAGLDRLPLPQVELVQGLADDWSGVQTGSFDLVVLNSVVQYFPGVAYLVDVLEGAVDAVAAGGAVFIGDVRSLPLLAAFHASVQIHRAEGSTPIPELVQRIARHTADEEELVIDPDLFLALARRLPAIRRVQVLLKRGSHDNELTRFRYDVILHVGVVEKDGEPPSSLAWDSLGALERLLAEGSDALAVSGIPNSRLAGEAAALELLAAGEARTVEELRAGIDRRVHARTEVSPEEIWALADRLGYDADLTWSPGGGLDGRFDAMLRRRAAGVPAGVLAAVTPAETGIAESPWSAYANDPLRAEQERRLVPELRRFLESELPEYMVPSTLVLLDALPLTPNGKIDRAALPAPERSLASAEGWIAPATPLEELLARVAAEVLGVERVGMRDNFFALGGHSLLATQLVSRLKQGQGVELTLQMVFETANFGALADRIVEAELASVDDGLLDEALREMEGMSPEELRALLGSTDLNAGLEDETE